MNVNTKVFVPFTEAISNHLLDTLGLSSADLVPFQLDYQCVQIELSDGDTATAATSQADA